jgi:hypothetical protein
MGRLCTGSSRTEAHLELSRTVPPEQFHIFYDEKNLVGMPLMRAEIVHRTVYRILPIAHTTALYVMRLVYFAV